MSSQSKATSPIELFNAGETLRAYAIDGLARIESEHVIGSHLLGVAAKAINLFESLLKDTVALHLLGAGLDYETMFRPKLRKPFDKLTLGELINCLRMLSAETISRQDQRPSDPHRSRRSSRMVSKNLSAKLDGIARLRTKVVAHVTPQEGVKPTEAKQLLMLINEALSDPLFSGQ
jgi:hypothetical protein